MPANHVIRSGGVPIHVFTDDIDAGSVQQLGEASKLPIIADRIAVMPDVHMGIGATIGSVIPTRGALSPAAVGVDIGCGMTAVKLSIPASDLPSNLRPARDAIENTVPVGKAGHQKPAVARELVEQLKPGLDETLEHHPTIRRMAKAIDEKWVLQALTELHAAVELGTLAMCGGGYNSFRNV